MPPPQTTLLPKGFYVEHHSYTKAADPLDQQKIVVEKGSAKTACDRTVAGHKMEGRIASLYDERTYEPRRLPFPAPEELDGIVSDHGNKVTVRNDLHADPSCNLCQARIILRLIIRSLKSLLSVFHTLPRNLVVTRR